MIFVKHSSLLYVYHGNIFNIIKPHIYNSIGDWPRDVTYEEKNIVYPSHDQIFPDFISPSRSPSILTIIGTLLRCSERRQIWIRQMAFSPIQWLFGLINKVIAAVVGKSYFPCTPRSWNMTCFGYNNIPISLQPRQHMYIMYFGNDSQYKNTTVWYNGSHQNSKYTPCHFNFQ